MIDPHHRRAVCALLPCGIAAAAGAEPQRRWNFRVYLDHELIGNHDFTLTSRDDSRELRSTAHFAAKFLFLTAFHYDHQAIEEWRGDCLSQLDSRTDDHGRMYTVHAS